MQNVLFEESIDGLYISRVVRDFKFTMPDVHIHYNDYEVYYLLEGERCYFIGTKIYHLKQGSLVFVRRNVIHKTALSREAHHDRILLEISRSYLESVFAITGELTLHDFFQDDCIILSLESEEQNFITELLLALGRELGTKNSGFRLLAKSLVAELFIYAKRMENKTNPSASSRTDDPRHRQIEQIACYIAENCCSPLSLNSIAEQFYMNKCYLSRIFKEITGFTVNGYLHARRIQKARSLLIQNSMNISEVAEAAGYENLTYFERVFKKHTGMSPLEYRRQYGKRGRRISGDIF
ncbi:MAG: helix-turn-helix transcriptional regulator [Lachnospiraceae bacterium]|nr:helix-turn-helix transcriptional regulator [Lachnospiraceae bacterium]